MQQNKVILRNGNLVFEDRTIKGDLVIENGKMPEAGTAEELLKKKGVYYKLYKMQAEALKTIGIEE